MCVCVCVAVHSFTRAEAGAEVFKRARIIGSTVVGAARRLQALRAAEPFAVIVEEACEVWNVNVNLCMLFYLSHLFRRFDRRVSFDTCMR